MLVKDETKYCWCDDEVAGEPQNSIKDAIQDYLEQCCVDIDIDCYNDNILSWADEVVEVGHPYYYMPKVDGQRVIWDVSDVNMDDEIYEYSDKYMKDVKNEHINELSEELTKVFQAWEKRHGYENKSFVVLETKTYLIGDYVKE